ncbi:RNA polymerase sigma factor [Dermatobacter hominis]|uniref:RNA polymerase sigma factor n=1 Tax=Dermatobacter hominis TaxID=2884263 RepID=UPI001D10A917|nr:sigma-70 family RNA polymerase sigma factor [Dermatobacter hominis]UDY37805.1 sigma-70 family RNA polymerase sigma factor [Dermatobacter hominis]
MSGAPDDRGASGDVEGSVSAAFRRDWALLVAHLISFTGDWDLAEECVQEAFAAAVTRWERDGVPTNPTAWLRTTARHRAIDRIRRAAVGRSKIERLGTEAARAGADGVEAGAGVSGSEGPLADDRLSLVVTCCHPALAVDAQVALTLREVAGLTTAEIARAFMVPTETMAKRLVRAKSKIRAAGIPFRVPPAEELDTRVAAVIGVVHGVFNEGYSASAGEQQVRGELCDEAIRLAGLLAELLPEDPEVLAVQALLVLHDARRAARFDDAGELVTLEDQDRTRWDHDRIDDGVRILDRSMALGRGGPYQLQAAIAACHATAVTAEATDWVQISALYGALARVAPSPVVDLNRAVARSMADGPAVGLAAVEDLAGDGRLDGYYLLHATRADLLRRLDRFDEAAAAYERALALAPTAPEQRFLQRRLREVAGQP